ncbi:MAG: choice-of-anchor Q domain-containing protein [Rubrobacteraceae bacterium]
MIGLEANAGAGVGARMRMARLAGWLAGAMLVALLVAGTMGAGKAWAETFVVNSLDDPGDGTCDDSECTLREAIDAANGNGEADTITFTVTGEIELVDSEGDLDIGDDLTIEGPGSDQLTVRQTVEDERVFQIAGGAEVTIEGIMITGGDADGSGQADEGGGIYNEGTLTVNSSTISGNSADGDGGGIYEEEATLTVNDSAVRGNSAGSNGGGIYEEEATLTVNDSAVRGNSAFAGGGIYNLAGTLTVDRSTISGNSVDGSSGGIYSQTTGVSDQVPDPTERTTITNSTISGNTADADDDGIGGRGGVYNNFGLTIIEYTTITNNTAPEGRVGGVTTYGDEVTRTEVGSSIIAANNGSDVGYSDPPVNPFVSLGYNVIGDGEGAEAFTGPNDIRGVDDPDLGPLANNGGPTQTHALQSGSEAIDRVAAGECPPPNIDQRGVSRPKDGDGNGSGRCDSGSFEKKPPPPDKANLSLSKKASKGKPTVGQKLTYTLRVKNNGPDRATKVKIVDTLPKGVKVLSTSKGCRKLTARKVRCNIARLGDGRSVARKIVVKVNRAGKLVNKARASSKVGDPNGRNNGARAVVRTKPKPKPKSKPKAKQKAKQVDCKARSSRPLALSEPREACANTSGPLARSRDR